MLILAFPRGGGVMSALGGGGFRGEEPCFGVRVWLFVELDMLTGVRRVLCT